MKKYYLIIMQLVVAVSMSIGQIRFDVAVIKQNESTSSVNELKLMNSDFTGIDELTYGSTTEITQLTSGDYNGDGRDDIAFVRNINGVNNYVLARKSDGNDIDGFLSGFYFYDTTSSGNNNINDITSGDFNGDGFDDLAINFDGVENLNYYNYIAIYLSDGQYFSCDSYFKYGGFSLNGITAGDYNGDGLDDIAFYRVQGDGDTTTKNKFLVFINEDGSFGSDNDFWYAYTDQNREFNGITSGDVDGDGLDDLIFVSDYDSDRFDRVSVFKSTITGFTHYFDYQCPYSSASYYGIASGDFNGDFMDDVVVYRDKYTTYDPRVFILKFISEGDDFTYTNSAGNYINLDYPIYDIAAGEFNPQYPYVYSNSDIVTDITSKISSTPYSTYFSSLKSTVNDASYNFNNTVTGLSTSASVDETSVVNEYGKRLKYAGFCSKYDYSGVSSKLSDVFSSIESFADFVTARKVNIDALNDVHHGIVTKQTLDDAVLLTDLVLAYDYLFPRLNDSQRSDFKTKILIPLVEKQLGYSAGRGNHSDWHNAALVAGGYALRNKRYIGLGCKGTNISDHVSSSGQPDRFWIGLKEQLSNPQSFSGTDILTPEIGYWGNTQNDLGTYISGDYFHDEGSTSYTRYSLMAMTKTAAITKINDYPTDFFDLNSGAMNKICQTMISTIYPSLNDFPDINNERLGDINASSLSDNTESVLEILNRFIYTSNSPYTVLLDHSTNVTCFEDLLFSESPQPTAISGNPLINESKVYPDGGWGILRSDNPISSTNALHIVTDFGPYGKNNHGHADRLSINLFRKNSTSNKVLLRDIGKIQSSSSSTYSYSSIIHQRWVASTISHNTVLINGIRQADPDIHIVDGSALRPITTFYSGSSDGTAAGNIIEHEYANKHAANISYDLTNSSDNVKYIRATSPFESSFGEDFEVSRSIELLNDRYIVDEIDVERRNSESIDFIDLFYHGPTDDLNINGTVSTQSTIWNSDLNSNHTSTYGYLSFNNALYNKSSGNTKCTWLDGSNSELTIWNITLNSSNTQHIVNCFGPIEQNSESVWSNEQHDILVIRNIGFTESMPEFLTVIDPYNEITNVAYSSLNHTVTITSSSGSYNYSLKFSNTLEKRTVASNLPERYELSQNYPNPFNPTTTIKYELPGEGLVTIKVFDVLGKEIITLIDEKQSSGRYEVTFNGEGLASGMYIYRIDVKSTDVNFKDYSSIRKMLLIK